MAIYRKLPVEVEAVHYVDGGFDEYPDWLKNAFSEHTVVFRFSSYSAGKKLEIRTLEGNMIADDGDYIIKGVDGELYPCKPGIFEKTYEEVV